MIEATKNNKIVFAASITLCITIFIYDTFSPTGWSEWSFYLIPLFIVSFSYSSIHLIIISFLSTIFIILGILFYPRAANLDISIFIRMIGIIFYWLLTYQFIKRNRVSEALRQSESRYHLLFDRNPKPLFVYELSTLKILESNRTALDSYGYSKEELLKMKITDLHEDTNKYSYTRHYANTSDEVITINECRHKRKDGKIIECDITSLKLRYGNSDARLVLVIDVTDLKHTQDHLRQSLEEKEILLKEVHHRVKNNMQTVSSLLNIQSRYIKDPAALEYFRQNQHRIQVMSLIHEKLYRTDNLNSIDFGQYIHQLSSGILQTYNTNSGKINLKLNIKDIFLNIDLGIPCGLIINELMTNSLKYAFPKKREGHIYITFNKDTVNGYILNYKDDGIGFPKNFDISKSKTLGLILVKTLTQQLHGNLKINNTSGIEYTITFHDIPEKKDSNDLLYLRQRNVKTV